MLRASDLENLTSDPITIDYYSHGKELEILQSPTHIQNTYLVVGRIDDGHVLRTFRIA